MKKQSIKYLISYILLAIITFSACKKEEDDDHSHDSTDKDKPTIMMTSPTDMQVFWSGDTVRIKGLVTDASLHELLIKIIQDSDGKELFKDIPVVHDLTTYTIDKYWKSHVLDHTNARLIVLAEDHEGNVQGDTTRIHIMP